MGEPRDETPLAALWRWLAARVGPELAEEARSYFNTEQRRYQQAMRDETKQRRRSFDEHRRSARLDAYSDDEG